MTRCVPLARNPFNLGTSKVGLTGSFWYRSGENPSREALGSGQVRAADSAREETKGKCADMEGAQGIYRRSLVESSSEPVRKTQWEGVRWGQHRPGETQREPKGPSPRQTRQTLELAMLMENTYRGVQMWKIEGAT